MFMFSCSFAGLSTPVLAANSNQQLQVSFSNFVYQLSLMFPPLILSILVRTHEIPFLTIHISKDLMPDSFPDATVSIGTRTTALALGLPHGCV